MAPFTLVELYWGERYFAAISLQFGAGWGGVRG